MAGYKRKSGYSAMTQQPGKKQRLATRNTSARTMYKPSRYVSPSKYIELKYDDGATSGTIPTAGYIINLTTIDNGTGASARIGSHVSYHDIQFNWIFNQSTATTLPEYCRAYLVYDKQVNGALPAVTDILNTATPQSNTKPNFRDRFRILWDSGIVQTYYSTAVNAGGAFTQSKAHGTKVVSLKGKRCEFNGASINISDIVSGALYFVAVSSVNNIHGFIETNRIQYYD